MTGLTVSLSQKVGELNAALEEYQLSLQLWELSKQPRSDQEIRHIQERIETVEQRISVGDTSADPQMDPVVLMRWIEMRKDSGKVKDSMDGGVDSGM